MTQWTPAETQRLYSAAQAGVRHKTIARELDRSLHSVESKLSQAYELGLLPPRKIRPRIPLPDIEHGDTPHNSPGRGIAYGGFSTLFVMVGPDPTISGQLGTVRKTLPAQWCVKSREMVGSRPTMTSGGAKGHTR